MAGEKNSKYKPEYDELVFNYCKMGATDAQLAVFFKVTEQTVNNWKNDHPAFFESLKAGKEEHDTGLVVNALLKAAIGQTVLETTTDEGTSAKLGDFNSTSVKERYIPPNPTSAIFWLKNRDPKRWKDKQPEEIEAKDTVIHEVKISVVDKNGN